MSEIAKNPGFNEPIVSIYDPSAYEMLPDSPTSRREIFDKFVSGFPAYLNELAATDQIAQELQAALDRLPSDHLAFALCACSEVDWTDESPISDVVSLFAVLKNINRVLNAPSLANEAAARSYGVDDAMVSPDAPLAIYTKWLFQDESLGVRHGYLWERYIERRLARTYARDKEAVIPGDVARLLGYADEVYQVATEQARKGVDSRQVGVGQVLGKLIASLGLLEEGDARYDYSVRDRIAQEVGSIVQENDQEALLAALLQYIEPVDVNCAEIDGAVFKPVVMKTPAGNVLFEELQRFDSFWFQPPFGDDETDASEGTDLFPGNPQIIRSYFDKDEGRPEDKRVTIHKDPSYFRPDGSKVYWGDLSQTDVSIIQGNYYCLSQGDSFHEAPTWAVIMSSFIDTQDPNRPALSLINTPEGQHMLPENPALLHTDYVRAVAIGAISSGRFIENKRGTPMVFRPTAGVV